MKTNQEWRDTIIGALVRQLEPLDFALTLWEAGSAAFGRVDAYSDIDLHLIIEDDGVEEAFVEAELALNSVSAITDKYRVPEPTWHGHSQAFYKLGDEVPEFMVVDLGVMKRSSGDKFAQPEVHGEAVVLFDKVDGLAVEPFDFGEHTAVLRERVDEIEVMFARDQIYVRKEILRGNLLDAIHFYPWMTIRPLVELLRIKYDPTRYQWGQRYLSYYLPEAEREKLESINLIQDLADLAEKQTLAQAWVTELVVELKYKL